MENGNKYPSSPPFLQTRVRKSVLVTAAVSAITAISVTGILLMLGHSGVQPRFDDPDVVLLIFATVFLTLMFYHGHYWKIARVLHVNETLAFHLTITVVLAVFVAIRIFIRN